MQCLARSSGFQREPHPHLLALGGMGRGDASPETGTQVRPFIFTLKELISKEARGSPEGAAQWSAFPPPPICSSASSPSPATPVSNTAVGVVLSEPVPPGQIRADNVPYHGLPRVDRLFYSAARQCLAGGEGFLFSF